MTRTCARRRLPNEIGIFDQPHAGLGVADELKASLMQRRSDAFAGMRLAAASRDASRLLPIGDGIWVKTGRASKLLSRPVEQSARRPDLTAHYNAAGVLAHAAIPMG
jgi:hypothetical protein